MNTKKIHQKIVVVLVAITTVFSVKAQQFELVKDINPGSAWGNPIGLTVFNNNLYFSANEGTNGYELWVTDGTANGTIMLKDIYLGSDSSFPYYFKEYNGKLYFNADDGTNGYEL